jgi:hypothetical protein
VRPATRPRGRCGPPLAVLLRCMRLYSGAGAARALLRAVAAAAAVLSLSPIVGVCGACARRATTLALCAGLLSSQRGRFHLRVI